VNFLPLTRPHLWIGLRSSGSLVSAISAENGEFSQDNRKGTCKKSTPRANEHIKGSILAGGLVSKLQRNAAQVSRDGVT
jgi:hypothetical protein